MEEDSVDYDVALYSTVVESSGEYYSQINSIYKDGVYYFDDEYFIVRMDDGFFGGGVWFDVRSKGNSGEGKVKVR